MEKAKKQPGHSCKVLNKKIIKGLIYNNPLIFVAIAFGVKLK